MTPLNRTRRSAYSLARALGTLQAAAKGPVPLAKREVRRKVYKGVNRRLGRVLRKTGLG